MDVVPGPQDQVVWDVGPVAAVAIHFPTQGPQGLQGRKRPLGTVGKGLDEVVHDKVRALEQQVHVCGRGAPQRPVRRHPARVLGAGPVELGEDGPAEGGDGAFYLPLQRREGGWGAVPFIARVVVVVVVVVGFRVPLRVRQTRGLRLPIAVEGEEEAVGEEVVHKARLQLQHDRGQGVPPEAGVPGGKGAVQHMVRRAGLRAEGVAGVGAGAGVRVGCCSSFPRGHGAGWVGVCGGCLMLDV